MCICAQEYKGEYLLHILTNRPALNAKCPPKNLMFLNNNNLALHMIKILTGDGCKPGGQSLAFLHFGKWNHSDQERATSSRPNTGYFICRENKRQSNHRHNVGDNQEHHLESFQSYLPFFILAIMTINNQKITIIITCNS